MWSDLHPAQRSSSQRGSSSSGHGGRRHDAGDLQQGHGLIITPRRGGEAAQVQEGKEEWLPFITTGVSSLLGESLAQQGAPVDPMSEEASFLRGKVEQDKDQQLVSVNSSRQEAGQMAGGVECFVGDRDRVDHLSMDPMVLEALGNREVQTKMKIGGR